MSERPVRPTPETEVRQQLAADPKSSVWVSANAGAGKTHVLTQRVLRLLLTGVSPAEILCLTYTKAAAAEMRARVTGRLGEWALMEEAELGKELADLTGAAPDADTLRRARTLFAHALDTPGGLKINTIHAFCEAVLHRFPLEAGVPFGFVVIEDAEREHLIREARDKVFAQALNGGALHDAVDLLFDAMSDFKLDEVVTAALGDMRKLMPVLADAGGARARLRALVKADQLAGTEAIRHAMTAETLITTEDIFLIRNELGPKPGGSQCIDVLAEIADFDAPTKDELQRALFTGKGEPRKRLLIKALAERFPGLLDVLEREQARLRALLADLGRAELVARSEALIDVLAAIVEDYETAKRARARLDFDDLVTRTAALFGDEAQGVWVRYKLDAGITHILVDESQDTNPEQWKVVDALADEFFAGDSAAQRPRSLFAVGDPKQSIFSFQGAEPRLFARSGDNYQHKAMTAGRPFTRVPMAASFRTLQNVLDAVDKVFAPGPRRDSVVVGEIYENHHSARTHSGGRVALWPVVAVKPAVEGTDPWQPSSAGLKSPEQQLAERISGSIAHWIASGRMLAERKRTIRADDVLILVQSRNALFHEIIRALKKAGLPTPGADRLGVGNHIVTRDLLALADVLLDPGDDLTLAALLRSPLFDVSEEDLFALAHDRQGTLWEVMRLSAIPSVVDAYQRLSAWRSRLDFERPYEFYADVLYAGGGLRRFHARLGSEVDDVIGEFLALALGHEQSDLPSLLGFVTEMRARKADIKRELGDTGAGVRVMTIHGAKGLEAPVVILADATSKPQGSQTNRSLYFAGQDEPPLLLLASRRDQHTEETIGYFDAEQRAQMDEYWRKLYVGMTRAEDELHIAGIVRERTKLEETWYGTVADALEEDSSEIELAPGLDAKVFPKHVPADTYGEAPETAATIVMTIPPKPLELRKAPKIVTPSRAGAEADPLDAHVEATGDADEARRAGIALHALLQHLPGVPETERDSVAVAALDSLLPEHPDRHAELAATALALIADPALSQAFGPNSRAEVAVSALARREGEDVLIAGRIDRLVITEQEVGIIDFKSDAIPPGDAEAIPPHYVAQLAHYRAVLCRIHPDKAVSAALLWTTTGQLMSVPESAMDDAMGTVLLC